MGPMSTLDTDLLAVVRGCYGAVRVRDLDLSRPSAVISLLL